MIYGPLEACRSRGRGGLSVMGVVVPAAHVGQADSEASSKNGIASKVELSPRII